MTAKIKWTSKMNDLLGTMPDLDVALRLGISAEPVRCRRTELGIPPYRVSKYEREWLPEMDALLGTMTDKKTAKKLGLTERVVAHRRRVLGISSYRNQNPPKSTRRQQERELPDTLTYKQWEYVCDYFDNRCAYCGENVYILTEDHLKPLSRGGPRTVLNIVPACHSCNCSKKDKRAHLWVYEKFGMEQGKEIINNIVMYLTVVRDG